MSLKPIGIHLGDFYSSVGTFEYTGVPEVIANDHGNLSTPSYVAFVGDQQVLIGDAAYNQATTNTKNTVFAVNRFIGRRFEDEFVQVQIADVPFSVVNVGGWPSIEVENRKYSPKYICSMILCKLKQIAESYLETTVTEAVITVPDYFNDSQREAVKDAASTVGLTVLRFIFESEAVTIAYELDKLVEDERKYVIILELIHEKNWNISIVDCAKGHELISFKNIKIVKCEFTDISDMVNQIRSEFYEIEQISDERLDMTDICSIVLAGHTTQIFKFDSFLKVNFIAHSIKISESIPHDKVFAYGATVEAARCNLQNEYSPIDRLFRFDCTPLNIGIVFKGGIEYQIIKRGTIIPTKKSQIYHFSSYSIDSFWIYEGQSLFAHDDNLNDLYFSQSLREIEATFEIDLKGTLIVSTNATNKSIEITYIKQRLKRIEIELMWEYAELHRVRDDYVRKYSKPTELLKFDNGYIYDTEFASEFARKYFEWTTPEIELPLESFLPQTLNMKIEKLLQELSDGFDDNLITEEAVNQSNFSIKKIINSLNNASDVLNRYNLTKNEFESVFINEQQVILETFEQAILVIRVVMFYDFLFKISKQTSFAYYHLKPKKSSNFTISTDIPNKVLLQIRSIQDLLILFVNVLRDKQTPFFGCSYFGVTHNTEAVTSEDWRFEILDSSITSIQQTLETKIDQLLQAFNSSSANSAKNSQVTNVIYNLKNLKNVLLNTNSDSTFGDITFTNDESVVTKHGDVDMSKLEQTISEMQKIMLKLETTEITGHSAREETVPININNGLQQMSGIEQLVNTLVSIKQTYRKDKSKKIIQNESLKSKRLKGKRNVEYKLPSQSSISNEQNFSNENADENICENANENAIEHFEIIECLENNEKSENNSQSTDQQKITVDLIEQKHPINENSTNKNTEITKSYNEHNCMVINGESIVQSELKHDDKTESNEANINQTIETVQIFKTNEHEIETNLGEQQQIDTTDEFADQGETILETEQLLQQKPVSELSNQSKCCCNLL